MALSALTPRLNSLEQRTLQAGVKNLIINGNFDVWQRGAGGFLIGTGYSQYTADRFCVGKDSTPNQPTVSRSTDVPTSAQSGFSSKYSLLVTNNASGSSPAAGDGLFINTRLEGHDIQPLFGNVFRFQFWVKSSVVGTYSLLFINKITGSNMRYYATTYAVNVANTWELKTVNITMDTFSGSIWNIDNTLGLSVHWTLSCGATVSTSTLNTWTTSVGQIEGTTSQVNWSGTGSSTFQLAQVALIPGSFDSDVNLTFKRAGRTIQDELAMCQRYFQKSFALNTTPINSGGAALSSPPAIPGAGLWTVAGFRTGNISGLGDHQQTPFTTIPFVVAMRTAPTITVYGNSSSQWLFYSTAGVGNVLTPIIAGVTETSFQVEDTSNFNVNTVILGHGHWTANADL